jgi:hypothetical protein
MGQARALTAECARHGHSNVAGEKIQVTRNPLTSWVAADGLDCAWLFLGRHYVRQRHFKGSVQGLEAPGYYQLSLRDTGSSLAQETTPSKGQSLPTNSRNP